VRWELPVLALVALAALPVVNLAGPQDRTRFELTRHIALYQTLTIEPGFYDRAQYHGKTYSDKAPGMSFLAIPAFEAERLIGIARTPRQWTQKGDPTLWLVRALTSGLLFLVSVFIVGRLAERFVRGTGALTAAIFGTATLAAPLAPTFFEHDSAAALGIAAFALVLRGNRSRPIALAGLCAGLAVFFDYSLGLVVLALAALCLVRYGRNALWFVAGLIPAGIALGAYDWAAFGSPLHLSYRYEAGVLGSEQQRGFFGISLPTLHGLKEVLFGSRGLLIFSPVLVAAAAGLVLMWRRGHRGEALVAIVLTVAFLVSDAGYFLPYGGSSPGPRFFVPALPFLVLGLPFAISRFPRTALVLAAASVVLMTADAVTWGTRNDTRWIPHDVQNHITENLWVWLGVNRIIGSAIMFLCGLAALAVGWRALRADSQRAGSAARALA
jgi:phage shock protein PspC (stress-responsive transcriptional regulator)